MTSGEKYEGCDCWYADPAGLCSGVWFCERLRDDNVGMLSSLHSVSKGWLSNLTHQQDLLFQGSRFHSPLCDPSLDHVPESLPYDLVQVIVKFPADLKIVDNLLVLEVRAV